MLIVSVTFPCTFYWLMQLNALEDLATDLIRIFNRLGVISSKDTHARYVEHVVTQYEEGNHLKDLIKGRFTVASLDNLDFIQSHAAVYCGDQHRSTHVTTIQVVQPKPSSLSATDHDLSSSRNDAPPCDHQLPFSQTSVPQSFPSDHDTWPMEIQLSKHQLLLLSTQLVEIRPSNQPILSHSYHQLPLSTTTHKEGHHQLSLSEPKPPDSSLNLSQPHFPVSQFSLSLTPPMETSSYTNGVLTADLSLPDIESSNTCLPLEQGQTGYNSSHFQTPGDIGPPAGTSSSLFLTPGDV